MPPCAPDARGKARIETAETMLSQTLPLAVGMIPLVLLAIAVAVRPSGGRPLHRDG